MNDTPRPAKALIVPQDITAPWFKELRIQPVVDLSNGSGKLRIEGSVADDLSGVNSFHLDFFDGDGHAFYATATSYVSSADGQIDASGHFSFTVDIGQYTARQVYTIDQGSVGDSAGNYHEFRTEEL